MKAVTLIKKIDELAEELLRDYTPDEVNKAFLQYSDKEAHPLNYITSNIYTSDEMG